MRTTQIKARLLAAAALLVVFGAGGRRDAVAQDVTPQDDSQPRQFTPREIVKARPKSNPAPAPVPRYQRVDSSVWGASKRVQAPVTIATPTPHGNRGARRTPPPPPKALKHNTPQPGPVQPVASDAENVAEIGVTFWKWRSAKPADNGYKILWQNKTTGLEELLTPTRISVSDQVHLGDRLQVSIESPRTGYLYIINRTQYDDSSTSLPQVIFPTTRTRGGDNRVTAGRTVFMPDIDDDVPFFTLEHEGTGQNKSVGEILDVIVSERPIPEMSNVGRQRTTLRKELVDEWGRKWGDIAEVGELAGGHGQGMSQVEKDAGTAIGRSLVQEDPTPQTLYHVRTKPGEPVMITLQLLYEQPRAPQATKANATSAKSK
jgi:hypothetical protein